MKEDKLIQKWIRKNAFLNRPDEMLYRSRSTDLLYTQWMSAYVLKYIHFNYHDKVLCIGCHGGRWVSDIDRTVNIKGYTGSIRASAAACDAPLSTFQL
ncbi:hypothetical protein [Macrococcoides canis]|uniref:hypothetical protein n=1 Tax=Macrococcoides canis TaxID=1855823 RepID=UPI0010FBE403|nr:hypothetical protein [Macrococcus canis]QCT74575.1 hypothetical protein EST43_04650 [Macrococcus canis]